MAKVEDNMSPFDLTMGATEKLSPPADFDGPVKNRRITDPTCLLVLLVVWGLATWLGVWSMQNGKYELLVHPTDYKGRFCGLDNDSNGDLLPSFWHPVDALKNGVCIETCPTDSNLEPTSKDDLICKADDDLLSISGCSPDGSISEDVDVLVTCGGCMYTIGSSSVNYGCVPKEASPVISQVNTVAESRGLDTLDDWTSFQHTPYLLRLVKDLRTTFPVFTGSGVGGAMLFGCFYILLFSFVKTIPIAVWSSAILVPFAFGGLGAFFFFLASEYRLDESGMHSNFKALTAQVLSYLLWATAAGLFLSVFFMRRGITLAVSIAKASSRSIREIRCMFLFPVIHLLMYCVMVGTLALWLLMLVTTVELVETTETVFGSELTFMTHKYPMFTYYKFGFLIFVFVWTSEFMLALGKITLSVCYSKWYYTPEKDEGNRVSVISGIFTSMIKHAGSAAFGSLLIKVIMVLRSPYLLLQSCIKRSGMDNICIDMLICSCQCGLFVLERFLKFTSKSSYIHTAIFGDSFCKSSHESYYLNIRNADIFGEAGPVGSLAVLHCKAMITSLITLITYVLMKHFYGEEIYNIAAVTAVLGIIIWFIAEMFTDVLAISVSTLLYCFVADEEIMGGEGSPFVPHELDEFLNLLAEGSDKLVMGEPSRYGDHGTFDKDPIGYL